MKQLSIRKLISVVIKFSLLLSAVLIFSAHLQASSKKIDKMIMQENHGHMGHMDHAAHMAMMQNKEFRVFNTHYSLPSVDLVTSEGKKFAINDIVNSDQPLAINFIFTTCTTICPVMTATFSQMRSRLGDAAKNLRMISITIDPEYDRPNKLKDYSDNFNAGYDWLFLTGKSSDVFSVIKSFDAYHGSKMNHKPLTLLKKPGDKQWVRIEGLVSSSKLAQLIQEQLLN